MQRFILFCVGLYALAASATQGGAVKSKTKGTPVESVISLLEKLSVEVQEEGNSEAAAYDKFACFCKTQSQQVAYAIAKGKKQIEVLEADIELLGGEIEELATAEQDSKKEVEATEATMKENQEKRDKDFEKFQMSEQDLKDAIGAITKAMEYLEASKKKLTDAKLSMFSRAVRDFQMDMTKALKNNLMIAVESLVQAENHHRQQQHQYRNGDFLEQPRATATKYGSNDIIDMLRELRREFSKNLAERVADEQQTNGDFELKQQAASNSVNGHKKNIAISQEIQGAKSDSKSGKEQLLEETQNTLDEDIEYQEEMTGQCEDKAAAWDERSKTRSQELTAISEALGILKGTVSEKYSANKKLVGLLSSSSSFKKSNDLPCEDDEDEDSDWDNDISFLQHNTVRNGRKLLGIRRKAVAYLARQARNLKSQELSALLLHLKADHFVKVRGLINDMVARLEAQASEEADQKAFCDEAMGEGITKRDEAQQDMEQANADVTKFTAEVAALREDITKLKEQIAELHKGLKEAQELRDEESRNNEQTVVDSKEGLDAVENAITVLKDFYEGAGGASLIQKASSQRQRPEAPETFEDDYAGKQEASKGIIGLLEVIKSDFERTIKTTEDGEKDAVKEFEKYKIDTEKDIETKVDEKKTKSDDRDTAETNIGDSKDEKEDASVRKTDALAILEKNRALCVDRGLSWEERTKRREHEIEALKEALHILDTAFD